MLKIDTKPALCKEYEVRAQRSENDNGFVGVFCIPAKDEQLARDDDGRIVVFDNEDEAVAAAGEDLCEALNAQGSGRFSQFGYRVMGGNELALRLQELDIDVRTFATFCGVDLERCVEWLQGIKPVPRTVYLISHLLGLRGARDSAEAFVREITFRKGGRP